MSLWLATILQEIVDFSNVLNASITASWLVLAVILLRLLLKKAPKRILVAMWGIVAVRLLMPISIESSFSLLPSTQTVSDQLLRSEGVLLQEPAYLELVTNPAFSSPVTVELGQSVGSFQWDMLLLTWPWIAGMAAMLLYAVVSWWRLYGRISTAVRYRDNIFQSEYVQSPFVFGVIFPRIYLPFGMKQEDLSHVVAHEQAHIRRKDHWWKLLGFLLLAIHWFNPLMWLAYMLLCRDMELACDESVIRDLSGPQRAAYSKALLNCSIRRHTVSACPLAFGEVGVKARIRSVAQYKKPGVWIMAAALVLCLVFAVCFLTDPVFSSLEMETSLLYYKNAIPLVEDQEELMAIYCPSSGSTGNGSIQLGVSAGTDLAKYLDRWDWKACKAPSDSLPSPGSVEFIVEEDYRITVHNRKDGQLRRYAVVRYGEEVQYYVIDRSDYPDAVALVMAPARQAQETEETRRGQYYLTIGAEDVVEIRIVAPDRSGGVQNADGTAYHRGERVWLEQLDGRSDLRGVALTALDSHGEICWSMSVPNGTENEGVQNVIATDWKLEYTE